MSDQSSIGKRPRVVLADDHMETARLLCTLLETEFDVVAHVEDGLALVGAVAQHSPDVIVTDISMPLLDGICATSMIRRSNPDARIVLVTVHAQPSLVEGGLAAGALGFVLKHSAGDDLVPAVHAALDGRQYISQTLGSLERTP